jgi:hypothetical protein
LFPNLKKSSFASFFTTLIPATLPSLSKPTLSPRHATCEQLT